MLISKHDIIVKQSEFAREPLSRLSRKIVVKALTALESYRTIRWIENFLKTRKTIIKINEANTNNIEIEINTLQKSSFSSILYLFYNANLIKTAKRYKCMLFTNFIDDVMFAITKKNSTINNKILVKAHEKTLKWTKLHKFKFFIKKYQLIHYSWKKITSINLIYN